MYRQIAMQEAITKMCTLIGNTKMKMEIKKKKEVSECLRDFH